MASNHCLHLALLFLLIGLTSSSYISYETLGASKSTGRSLLQAKKDCPVDLESKNYTILTSKCKGPDYPPTPCCEALMEFVCPFVEAVNDLNTNCADTMFSYINLYGRYPPGLFANQCKGGKEGLSCEKFLNVTKSEGETGKSSAAPSQIQSLAAVSATAFLLLLVSSLF